MKKAGLLIVLFCSVVIYATSIPREHIYIKSYETTQKALRDTVNMLFGMELYDSVIEYCLNLSGSKLDYDNKELALATAWWYKGDKSRAYQYILNNVDYSLRLNGGGGRLLSVLYDYTFGPAIPTDTFLEQMALDKVSDYYRSLEYYPDRYTGLQLIKLEHKQEKLESQYKYHLSTPGKEDSGKALRENFEQEANALSNELLEMLKEHKKIFIRKDVGPAEDVQFQMINNLLRPEDHAFCRQMLYQAMTDKIIKPDIYVEELVAMEKLKEKNGARLNRFRDSLCKVFNCESISGDSLGRQLKARGIKGIEIWSDTISHD